MVGDSIRGDVPHEVVHHPHLDTDRALHHEGVENKTIATRDGEYL